MTKCTKVYIEYQKRKCEYCRATPFAGLGILVLPIDRGIFYNVFASWSISLAYSQSCLCSNTQEATSAHISYRVGT